MRPPLDAILEDMEATGHMTSEEVKNIHELDQRERDQKVCVEQFQLRMTAHVLKKDWKMDDFTKSNEYIGALNNLIKNVGLLEADQVLEMWFHSHQSLFV